MKLIQQRKEKYQDQQRNIHNLEKRNESLTVQLDALQSELKMKETNYMKIIQHKDKKHQEQQWSIHNLEESNKCLNVKLGNLQNELQMQDINHMKLLESTQQRIQELEHHLLQRENQCHDQLKQIEGQKMQFKHQAQHIKDLKMKLKTLKKCCCNNPFSDGWEYSLNDKGSTNDTLHNQQEMDKCDFNQTYEGSLPG